MSLFAWLSRINVAQEPCRGHACHGLGSNKWHYSSFVSIQMSAGCVPSRPRTTPSTPNKFTYYLIIFDNKFCHQWDIWLTLLSLQHAFNITFILCLLCSNTFLQVFIGKTGPSSKFPFPNPTLGVVVLWQQTGLWFTEAKIWGIAPKAAWHWGSDTGVTHDPFGAPASTQSYVCLPPTWGSAVSDSSIPRFLWD
jgi:hypothetical protein